MYPQCSKGFVEAVEEGGSKILRRHRADRITVQNLISPPGPVFRILEEWKFISPEQEAQLSQIGTHAGTDAELLVKNAALRLLQEEARFRAAVREGIAQADRGEFIEEEEMDARLEEMLRS